MVPTPWLSLYAFAHVAILSVRSYFIYLYLQVSANVDDEETLGVWLRSFKIGTFFTGLAWGLTFYVLKDLPIESHFIVFAMLVGIASVGLLSIGVISSIFNWFMFPLLGGSALWMLTQDGSSYAIAGFLTIFGMFYYSLQARVYDKNFHQLYIDKEAIKEYARELEAVQRTNDMLKQRTDLALGGTNTAILDWDYVDKSSYISPNWKEMLGFSDDELENTFRTWKARVHKEDVKEVIDKLNFAKRVKAQYFYTTHRLRRKNGSYIWILGKARLIYNKNKKVVRMVGTHTDITKEKEIELKNERQAKIIEQIHDAVVATDLQGVVTSWNKGAELLTGYESSEFIGKNISELFSPKENKLILKNMKAILRGEEYRIQARVTQKSKKSIDADATFSVLRDERNKPIGIIGYAQDVTERETAQKALLEEKGKLSHQANHDTLTGLPNRALFNDRLERSLLKAKRNDTKIALLFIDLDHFKDINDSLGHVVGDKVLQRVSQLLLGAIREEDTLSRLGGDEFTIILENLTQGQDASLLAKKIIDALSKTISVGDHDLYVSCSVGVSLYPDDGNQSLNLIKYADSAMYKAKSEGRNNFQFYSSEMTELAFERLVMETSLREAIKKEEFVVYYQAQVNGTNNKIVGMEALVRWNHPTMGLVSPNYFIPLAESTGLIVEIDRYVMKTAMRDLAHWREQGLTPGVLSMNLAIKQLKQQDFLSTFDRLMRETSCKPEWIALEVTEGQIMSNPEESIKVLRTLSDLGIALSVDDFGTGYSSLSYLKKLPIDKLKIDQSFVRDLPDDEEDAAIAKAVIALAKSLNLGIIAEGVETEKQKNFMIENGCEHIQGYLYSKPAPASEFKLLLSRGF